MLPWGMLPCIPWGCGRLSVGEGALPFGNDVFDVVVLSFLAPGYIGTPSVALLTVELFVDLPQPANNASPATIRTAITTAMRLLIFITLYLLLQRGSRSGARRSCGTPYPRPPVCSRRELPLGRICPPRAPARRGCRSPSDRWPCPGFR